MSCVQVEDRGGNILTEVLTIIIDYVNDNDPQLILDGSRLTRHYRVDFYEGQDYLGGADPVYLSDNLMIVDEDAGPQDIQSAIISIIDSKLTQYWDVIVNIFNLSGQTQDILQLSSNITSSFVYEVMTGTPTIISLNGTASVLHYIDILSNITFVNLADEPGYTNRTVVFELVDDRGFVFNASTLINIIPTNDPTIFSFNNRIVIFNEMARVPVNLLQSNDNLTDPDGNNLSWLAVAIIPPIDELDVLFADPGSSNLEIETSSNGLNITGYANFSVYSSILQTLTFYNPSPDINLANRSIHLITFDGVTESPPTEITVVIDGFNDIPVCYFTTTVSTYTMCRSICRSI